MSVTAAFFIDAFSTQVCQTSYLLMKFAHVDAEERQVSAYCSFKWWMGMICLTGGSLMHVVMLPFCPVVLLAANSATAIIMSAMLAVYFLEERIVWCYDLLAFVLISAGTAIICLLSQENETRMTTEDITGQLVSIGTLCFGLIYVAFVVVNYMLTRWSESQIRLFERQAVSWANSIPKTKQEQSRLENLPTKDGSLLSPMTINNITTADFGDNFYNPDYLTGT